MAALLMLLLGLISLLVTAGVIFLWREAGERSARRKPQSRKLLRSPGESLRAELEELQWDLSACLAFTMLPLPLAIAVYIGAWLFAGAAPSASTTIAIAGVAAAAHGWLAWKIGMLVTKRRLLKLAHEAEISVGQELGELGRAGYRIFHDFPVEDAGFNIDHIVVGPAGVFAVETKARARRSAEASWAVESDGRVLRFPGWEDDGTLRQAMAAAQWLGAWLTSAVGEKVKAEPLVVLPGWFVRRTAEGGVPVYALKEISRRFSQLRVEHPLSERLIRQIAHQLTERGREVAPTAYPAASTERQGKRAA